MAGGAKGDKPTTGTKDGPNPPGTQEKQKKEGTKSKVCNRLTSHKKGLAQISTYYRFRPIYLINRFGSIQISSHIQHPIIPYPSLRDEICVRFEMGRNLLKLKWDEICHGTKSVTAKKRKG